MKILAVLLLLAGTQAHAASVLDASLETSIVSEANNTHALKVVGVAATKLYNALDTYAVPGWEDINATSKSLAGIYCFSQRSAYDIITTECTISFDRISGVKNALRGQPSDAALTLSLAGDIAAQLYRDLDVSERASDAEGLNWVKVVDGISAQEHRLTNTWGAVVVIELSQGVLR